MYFERIFNSLIESEDMYDRTAKKIGIKTKNNFWDEKLEYFKFSAHSGTYKRINMETNEITNFKGMKMLMNKPFDSKRDFVVDMSTHEIIDFKSGITITQPVGLSMESILLVLDELVKKQGVKTLYRTIDEKIKEMESMGIKFPLNK